MLRPWFATLMALAVSSAIFGQGRLTSRDLQARLDRSEREWQRLIALHGESYTYVATSLRADGDGGGRTDTEITVEDGTIVERVHSVYDGTGLVSRWRETGDAVGLHGEGAPPLTMDELYGLCRTEVLALDADRYWLILDLDQQGLLQRCATVQASPTVIQPVGINLAWVRLAP